MQNMKCKMKNIDALLLPTGAGYSINQYIFTFAILHFALTTVTTTR